LRFGLCVPVFVPIKGKAVWVGLVGESIVGERNDVGWIFELFEVLNEVQVFVWEGIEVCVE